MKYTLVERRVLLDRKPDIDDANVKVWTIKKDEAIRVNYVEMTGELPLHMHPDAAHSLMVLSGQVRVRIGNEIVVIDEGDYLSIPAEVPHRYWALCAISPSGAT